MPVMAATPGFGLGAGLTALAGHSDKPQDRAAKTVSVKGRPNLIC
ncbi:MAG: hypothetical protein NTW80_07300 [Deltaproteobacteria bacterium]|nr:hypothetical protein [Deltaproteobacteria bacterium]